MNGSWFDGSRGNLFTLSALLHLTVFFWVFQNLLRKRRDPVSAVLWMMTVWTLPGVGILLYLSFGLNRIREKSGAKAMANRTLLEARGHPDAETLPIPYWRAIQTSVAPAPTAPVAARIDRTLDSLVPQHPLLTGNRIHLRVTGNEAFPAMFEAIDGAQDHIHLQSFIIGHDAVGHELMERLARRARAGVRVRLLYDRFGSTHAALGGLFRAYRETPNLTMAGWTMASLLKRQFAIHLRNHRKVLVVDGHRAFTGGINLAANETTTPGHPAIRDYHFELTGPIVAELQYTFLRDWFYMTREDPASLLTARYFPVSVDAGEASLRVINGGPATELNEISDALFSFLVNARKQILAVTPYFVPTPDVLRALRNAAFQGVDVRLIVPAHNNHRYAGLAGRSYYEELLEAGVRIFERSPPFLHAKSLVVDDEVAMIGTANLDVRSLRLNYETNLAVYDSVLIQRLKRTILEEHAASEEIRLEAWMRRPLSSRMLENACSFLAPVL